MMGGPAGAGPLAFWPLPPTAGRLARARLRAAVSGRMVAIVRTLATVVLLAAGTAALDGCGSSGKAGAAGSTSAPAASPPAVAAAYAHAVNLEAADVPGAAVLRSERPVARTALRTRFARCAGAVDPASATADFKSATLRTPAKPVTRVSSTTTVFPSPALAEHNYSAGVSPRGRGCLRKLLVEALRREAATATGAAITATDVTALARALPGAAHAVGVRARVLVSGVGLAGRVQVPVYIDDVSFVAGQAEVTLTATRTSKPPDAGEEKRLLARLYGRAHGHTA